MKSISAKIKTILLFFGIISSSFAQTYTWVGGTSTDFYNVNNWDNTAINFAAMNSSSIIIGAGNPNNPTNIGHSGNDVIARRPNNFTTNVGANVIVNRTFYPYNTPSLNGTITIEGSANFNSRNTIYLGKADVGNLIVNAGSITCRNVFYVGNAAGGNGSVTINGGNLWASSSLEVGTGTGDPIGKIDVIGGTVNVATNLNIGTNGQVFITGLGQILVTGDKRTALNAYVASGKISCPPSSTLSVTYDGSKTSVAIYQDPNRMIQEFADYILLKNGIIEAKIQKRTSNIQSLKINGVETLYQSANSTRVGSYYDFVTSQGFETIYGATFSIKEETADYIDVSFSRPYKPGANVTRCDVDIHYVLKKGDTGVYTYSILKHKAEYPDFDLGSWRQVLWIDSAATNKIYATEQKSWQMPAPGDVQVTTPIAEIIKFETGVRAGKYDGKYQFCENLIELSAYGHSTDTNSLGIWAVTGNHEYFPAGPNHHDLNVANGIIHVCMNGVHYNSKGFVINQGEEWSKIYGPYLILANQNPSGDANWAAAKARAAQDKADWPFAWLTNTPEYPLAAGRGNITGTFVINDPAKPTVTGKDAWIGVTKLSNDSDGKFQYEEENYQYWVKTDASGNFDIKNVRPGTYTLFAYSDGVTGEYSMANVTVAAGATNSLGNVVWNIARTNGTLVWEIGVPNRTTSEFKLGDFDYSEGFVQNKFSGLFTNPIEYNVADKNWSTALPYVHSKYYNADGTINGNWSWDINFELPAGMPTTGNARLTIAYASSDYAQQWIYVNTTSGTPTSYYPPEAGGNAFVRQSNHAKYATKVIDIPMSKLNAGSNFIRLLMPSNSGNVSHLMYDYISLEAILNPNDLDNDGVLNTIDACPNTANGDSVNSSGCSNTQLSIAKNEILAPALKAYPNPTTGIVEVEYTEQDNQEVDVAIFDIQMKLLTKENYKVYNHKIKLNLQPFSNGVYFVKIGTTNNEATRILKQ